MKRIFFILVVVLIPSVVLADWDGPHRRHSFPTSFPAGHEADGRTLYISQCVHRDQTFSTDLPYYSTSNRGWHIGKAGTHLSKGMTFSWGGSEYDSDHCRRDEHWVYLADDGATYRWVAQSGGAYPTGAVKGYNGSEQHHICRVNFQGGVHPGKLIPSSNACFIGWGGREHGIQNYEVLVKD